MSEDAAKPARAPKTRLMIEGGTTPHMPRHIKMRHDPGRDRWIILAPERVFDPDPTAVSVLKLCSGKRSVDDIAAALAEQYNAPVDVIRDDIIPMLQDLADKGVIEG